MHHHLEIIMPPTDDVERSAQSIMQPFSENNDHVSSHAFWDFFVIGGRYAGSKLKASVDAEQLDAFYEKLNEMKITVSALTAGKQSLQPAEQIPVVDSLWAEMFPDSGTKVCPLFSHSNDQYNSSDLILGDVANLEKTLEKSPLLTCGHIIIAGPKNNDDDGFKANEMFQTEVWNGVSYQDTTWDGSISQALEMFTEKTKNYADEFLAKATPQNDWLVVTVDYHS